MGSQRISYVPVGDMDDQMRAEMERCSREGTPRPESSAVRAHVPACFWSFANSWQDIFRSGVCDHRIKELCRVYISRSVNCEYCGNQRSVQAAASGLSEAKYDDLLKACRDRVSSYHRKPRLGHRHHRLVAAPADRWPNERRLAPVTERLQLTTGNGDQPRRPRPWPDLARAVRRKDHVNAASQAALLARILSPALSLLIAAVLPEASSTLVRAIKD